MASGFSATQAEISKLVEEKPELHLVLPTNFWHDPPEVIKKVNVSWKSNFARGLRYEF